MKRGCKKEKSTAATSRKKTRCPHPLTLVLALASNEEYQRHFQYTSIMSQREQLTSAGTFPPPHLMPPATNTHTQTRRALARSETLVFSPTRRDEPPPPLKIPLQMFPRPAHRSTHHHRLHHMQNSRSFISPPLPLPFTRTLHHHHYHHHHHHHHHHHKIHASLPFQRRRAKKNNHVTSFPPRHSSSPQPQRQTTRARRLS